MPFLEPVSSPGLFYRRTHSITRTIRWRFPFTDAHIRHYTILKSISFPSPFPRSAPHLPLSEGKALERGCFEMLYNVTIDVLRLAKRNCRDSEPEYKPWTFTECCYSLPWETIERSLRDLLIYARLQYGCVTSRSLWHLVTRLKAHHHNKHGWSFASWQLLCDFSKT